MFDIIVAVDTGGGSTRLNERFRIPAKPSAADSLPLLRDAVIDLLLRSGKKSILAGFIDMDMAQVPCVKIVMDGSSTDEEVEGVVEEIANAFAPGFPRPAYNVPAYGVNIGKKPIHVNHEDLKRVGESAFKSECPVCKDGILTVLRNPVTLELSKSDNCLLCGQSFVYDDTPARNTRSGEIPERDVT